MPPKWQDKQPTCWQFFGLNGPTNKHNLDLLYKERYGTGPLAGFDPPNADEKYRECLKELDAEIPTKAKAS